MRACFCGAVRRCSPRRFRACPRSRSPTISRRAGGGAPIARVRRKCRQWGGAAGTPFTKMSARKRCSPRPRSSSIQGWRRRAIAISTSMMAGGSSAARATGGWSSAPRPFPRPRERGRAVTPASAPLPTGSMRWGSRPASIRMSGAIPAGRRSPRPWPTCPRARSPSARSRSTAMSTRISRSTSRNGASI